MKRSEKHIIVNLQKASAAFSFSFIFFMALFVACSTPTVSSDDSDENSLNQFSSSGERVKSSGSEKPSESSSSLSEADCAALLEGETEWRWDIPKDCRFNPDIDYGTMTDSRDGQVYRTVDIGGQTWMAENLNYASSAKTPGLLGKSWCFDNDSEKCAVTGHLYTWAAAIDSATLYNGGKGVNCGEGKTCRLPSKVRRLCPNGWHLPDTTEWNTLFTKVGGRNNAGKVLRSRTGWNDCEDGTDDYGFSVLPDGGRYYDGLYDFAGSAASIWSTSQDGEMYAYIMDLSLCSKNVYLNISRKTNGHSVRCVKD